MIYISISASVGVVIIILFIVIDAYLIKLKKENLELSRQILLSQNECDEQPSAYNQTNAL